MFGNTKQLLEAHQKLGFPAFSKEDQIHMVCTNNYEGIANLTDFRTWNYEILDHYIFVSPDEVAAYLVSTGKINKSIIPEKTKQDGIWIVRLGEKYEVIDQERGLVYFKHVYDDIFGAATYVAKVLLAHIPKYPSPTD